MAAGTSPPSGLTLVTGASGFVGQNLVALLLDRGFSIRTYGRRPLTGPSASRVEHVIGDVRDADQVAIAMRDVEVVFHLAAHITLFTEDPDAWPINVHGPQIVADAARQAGVRRLIHCSSVHAFDPRRPKGHIDELSPRPGAAAPLYGRTKAAGEEAVRRAIDAGLDATIINPTGIVGPVDLELSRVNRLLLTAARGHLPAATGGGYDFVDVRDVVLAALAALDRGRTGENYLVTGHRTSALRLARMAAGMNGHLGPAFPIPLAIARRIAPAGERIGRVLGTDSFTPAAIAALGDYPEVSGSKAMVELGYRPRPLEDTVRDLVWWFRDTGRLDPPTGPR